MHQYIFDHANDVILFSDQTGKIMDINSRVMDLFGVKPKHIINTRIDDIPFFNETDKKRIAGHILDTVSNPYGTMLELSFTTGNGTQKTAEINSRLVRNGNGLNGIISIIRDISDRKRVEEISRKNEENFKMFFENANDGIVYLDRNAVIRASNKKIEDLFGFSHEDVIGRKFMEFPIFNTDDMNDIYAIFLNSIEGSLPPLLEFEGYHRDGNKFYLEISPTLIKEEDEIVGLLAIIRDVTTRKRAEEERVRLIDIIEATPDFVITFNSSGHIRYVNKAGRNVLGISPGNGYSESNLPNFETALPKLTANGIWTGEARIMTKEGKPIQVSQVIMAHCMGNLDTPYFSTIMRDISDQKQNENHIKYLTHHLIRVQEDERARIARDLHDNLAQDLSTLKILCETLFDIDSEVPSAIRRKISEMSGMFKKTIDSIRDITYNLRPASLHELGLVNTLYQFCDEFRDHQLHVIFHTAGMQRLKFDFDTEINLYRIVQEVFNNIRKHSNASEVKVNLTASYPVIILQIEDNGSGFNVEKRKKELIHEKRMGLKSIEERVGLLNGTFRIQSKISVGTVIHIEVPYTHPWNPE